MLKLIIIILYVLTSFQYNVESNEIENCDIDLAQIQNECQLKHNNILKGLLKLIYITKKFHSNFL